MLSPPSSKFRKGRSRLMAIVRQCQIKAWLVGTVLVWGVCLFIDGWRVFWPYAPDISRNARLLLQQSLTQELVAVTCFFWVFMFSLKQILDIWPPSDRIVTRELALTSCMMIGVTVGFLDKGSKTRSDLTMLLFSVMVARGILIVGEACFELKERCEVRSILRSIVIIFGLTSLWSAKNSHTVAYRSQTRWSWPWDSPNSFGLLMGMGLVLGIGLLISGWRSKMSKHWKLQVAILVRMAFIIWLTCELCMALLKSWSRGAWVASGVAGLYLLCYCFNRYCFNDVLRIRLRRTSAYFFLGLCALLTVLFWKFQNAETLLVKRAVSISNKNDFSGYNRSAAWEGSLQMMAARPWLGFGWGRPESFYDWYYSNPRLEDTKATGTNDYLILGTTFGIPALCCFIIYIWITLTHHLSIPCLELDVIDLSWLKVTCSAGALVLAVGFWFNGGLFQLPTAVSFWILLELGREG